VRGPTARRRGRSHRCTPGCVASTQAFVDRFLKGQTANTAIVVQPQEGNFDLDFKDSIDWQTPTLQ